MRGDNKNSLGPPVYNPNGTSNSSSVFVGRYVYNNRPHLCTACMRCGLIIISVLMPITLTSTEAGVRGGSFQERGKFSGGVYRADVQGEMSCVLGAVGGLLFSRA